MFGNFIKCSLLIEHALDTSSKKPFNNKSPLNKFLSTSPLKLHNHLSPTNPIHLKPQIINPLTDCFHWEIQVSEAGGVFRIEEGSYVLAERVIEIDLYIGSFLKGKGYS